MPIISSVEPVINLGFFGLFLSKSISNPVKTPNNPIINRIITANNHKIKTLNISTTPPFILILTE